MVNIQRKIKCKFSGQDKYLPEGMPVDTWIPVIGYETRRRKKIDQKDDNRTIEVEDVILICIGNSGRLIHVAEFNCSIMIDEAAELSLKQCQETLNTAAMLGKVLSEKLATYPDVKKQ